MKPPLPHWVHLDDTRRALIDARDLTGWSPAQLRAEIGRRQAFADLEPVAYWLRRLQAQLAVTSAERAVNSAPRHEGLRVVPRRTSSPWRYMIVHTKSGQEVIGLDFPDSGWAHEAADRLGAICDWHLPPPEWGTGHARAAAAERALLERTLGFTSWPSVPDSPEGL
ncbi:hypothetical protein ACWECC_33465 [Streptomyces microflavus]